MAMYVFPSSSCDGGEGTLGARRSRGGGRTAANREEGGHAAGPDGYGVAGRREVAAPVDGGVAAALCWVWLAAALSTV